MEYARKGRQRARPRRYSAAKAATIAVGTVTVAARSCVEANALSTAAIIRGTEAPAWLADVAPARLVSAVGDVVTTGGWPAPTRLAA